MNSHRRNVPATPVDKRRSMPWRYSTRLFSHVVGSLFFGTLFLFCFLSPEGEADVPAFSDMKTLVPSNKAATCEAAFHTSTNIQAKVRDYDRRLHALWSDLRQDEAAMKNSKDFSSPAAHPSSMVMVFAHIPKTGGTTIRTYLASNPAIRLLKYSLKPGDLERSLKIVERHLESSGNGIMAVEFHGQGLFGRNGHDWIDVLRKWKEKYQEQIFVFSLWRHPAHHLQSYYHYLHNKSDVWGEHFLKNDLSAIFSRQCASFRRYSEPPISPLCREVYESLLAHTDWMGTTETLDTVTLPLLDQVIATSLVVSPTLTENVTDARGSIATPHRHHHKNVGQYHRASISNKLIEWIEREGACEDYWIWNQIQESISRLP